MTIVHGKTYDDVKSEAKKVAKEVLNEMNNAHKVAIEVTNDTATDHKLLELHDSYHAHGRWANHHPDPQIAAISGSVFGSENRDNALTGTAGVVSYKIKTTKKDCYLLIYFSKPASPSSDDEDKACARVVGKDSGHPNVSAEHWYDHLSNEAGKGGSSEAHDLHVSYSAGSRMRFVISSTKN